MPKFLIHLVGAAATAGALQYASVEVEAASKNAAVEQLEAKLKSGEIEPSWSDATAPIETKAGMKAFLAGIEDEDEKGENWPKQDRPQNNTGAEGGTSPSSGMTLPLNSSAGDAASRLTRNLAPTLPGAMQGIVAPAKTRPGEHPIPLVSGDAQDPEKSPTPAADGVTHLPKGQRSMATPTPGRTIGMGGGSGRAPQVQVDEAALKAAAETPPTEGEVLNSQSPTLNTGGKGPAAAAAEQEAGEGSGEGQAEAPATEAQGKGKAKAQATA